MGFHILGFHIFSLSKVRRLVHEPRFESAARTRAPVLAPPALERSGA